MFVSQHVKAGADRGDLHRDVVDLGSFEQVDYRLSAPTSLLVTEDRFAEQVHVQPDVLGCATADVTGETARVSREHDGTKFVPEPVRRERHDKLGEHGGETGARGQRQLVEAARERGDAALGNQVGQTARGAPPWTDPQHLVGEVDEELTA